MKLTRENIYVPLEGKSKEELTDLWEFLNSIGEQIKHSELAIFITAYHNRNRYISYCQNKWQWGVSRGKQEVTIQQLKEILQPMENTKFKKDDVIIITDFGRITSSAYTHNFTLNKPYILEKDFNKENGLCVKIDDNNNKRNGWTNAFDLGIKIELYKKPTLTEQLEKAEAEVKRLKKAIEEESKPKIGDWLISNDNITICKVTQKGLDYINDWETDFYKCEDQELIKKLNELIK